MNTSTKKGIPTNRGGIIRTVLFIVVVLLVISYFGLNLRSIVNSPAGQSNFSYVGEVLSNLWNNYLKVPVTYFWNIFVTYIWTPLISNLMHASSGQPNTINASMIPTVPQPPQMPN